MSEKRIFSGIKPTGLPTLGNYLGAMQNWVAMQSQYHCLYCVVDLHAITVRLEPERLRSQALELFATLLSVGLDPDKGAVYLQSHVHEHAELAWLLNCYTMFGELSRMTQFKDKSQKAPDNINAGLFTYPSLMAADILLFDTHLVPVGDDQKQHVELTRDIAARFNSLYGDVFVMPEPYIPKVGARIMSLTDPLHKMDKTSENPNSYIIFSDSDDVILKKCKRAVTDSEAEVRFDPANKPGVSNLLTIYSLCTGKTIAESEQAFAGQGYGVFKPAVGEAVIAKIAPVRKRIRQYLDDPAELSRLMAVGAQKARAEAAPVLRRVRDAIGFLPQEGTR